MVLIVKDQAFSSQNWSNCKQFDMLKYAINEKPEKEREKNYAISKLVENYILIPIYISIWTFTRFRLHYHSRSSS